MIRIRKVKDGFVTERKTMFWWYTQPKWIPYTETFGMPGVAWVHETYGMAMSAILNKIEKGVNFNSNNTGEIK